MSRKFQVILACTLDCGIGKDGTIPWHIPQDMQRFRKITCITHSHGKQNMIIMGRKTWESLPKRPLPNRKNVVVTKMTNIDGAICTPSMEDALMLAERDPTIENVFVIGGAQLYNEAIIHPMCDKVYVTMINEPIECDTFFDPDVLQLFYLECITEVEVHNDIEYAFAIFRRHPSL